MKEKISIFWFRRDLRWNDNVALFNALNSNLKVLPIFIFDPDILNKLNKEDHRVSFIYDRISELNLEIGSVNTFINIHYEKPLVVFKKIISDFDIDTVYCNVDYEPFARKRDLEVENYLIKFKIKFKQFKDQVIFEKNEVLKKDLTPYKVYTPYSKAWICNYESSDLNNYPSELLLNNLLSSMKVNDFTLNDMGFQKSRLVNEDFNISLDLIDSYEEKRNFPSLNSTSKIGVHLRFGTISIRDLVKKAHSSNNHTFLKELIWREFYMHIIWFYPHTVNQSFKAKYDNIKWRNDLQEFKKWCDGETGYPLVDAGMRELNSTGFMHNRVRMVVASFLCKHLLIDWRLGEAYFAEKLFDYELSSNVGNWQWVVGSGVDAAPYFRIFNPETQIQKFDKNYNYIKKWVPEFNTNKYSVKIVDHKFARERCLNEFKSIQ